MALQSFDSEFDRYRRNRKRFQNKELPDSGGAGYENSALRELELVEAREVRDQQLTREVHEFFSTATQQAAGIVERMAHDAEAQADVKIEQEMEEFLIDAFARMNGLVMALVQKKKGGIAEQRLEPKVANLVGEMLDEFRWEGTADLMDKHIGQDPFATDLDDVRRELQTHKSDAADVAADGEGASAIEEHLVAAMDDEDVDDSDGADAEVDAEVGDMGAPRIAMPLAEADDVDDEPVAAATPIAGAPVAGTPKNAAGARKAVRPRSQNDELERFKEALKSLVRQETMSRDEARAAWGTRLRSLGLIRES